LVIFIKPSDSRYWLVSDMEKILDIVIAIIGLAIKEASKNKK
jgi:hypothetical protein